MADTSSSTTTEIWQRRVAAWRASGERADDFSRDKGYAASTLRWWACKLERAAPAASVVQLARVVRAGTVPPSPSAPARAAIVIEAGPAGARVVVSADADRATLAMVLDVLGVGSAR